MRTNGFSLMATVNFESYEAQGWFQEEKQVIEELDEISHANPILIMRDDCHAYWVNSRLLAIANITEQTQGLIGRHDGKLNGMVSEDSMNLIRKHIPKLSTQEQAECLQIGLRRLVENGIVAFQDAAVKENLFNAYQALYSDQEKAANLPYACLSLSWNSLFLEQTQNSDSALKFDQVIQMREQLQQKQLPKLFCNSVKLFIDGVVESKTALLNTNYCNCHSNGVLLIDNLQELINWLIASKFQVHVHTIGDKSTDLVVESFEKGGLDLTSSPISYLAHLQFVSEASIPKFKKLKLGANFSPLWFYEDPKLSVLFQSVPEKYYKNMYPIKELLEDEVTVGFGSDWPVSDVNPFCGIEVAVTRQPLGHDQAPVPIGNLKQRISVEEALYAYTEGSAKLIQKEQFGKLEAGCDACFLVLNQDVLNVPSHRIHETQVLATYMSGRMSHNGGLEQKITEIF